MRRRRPEVPGRVAAHSSRPEGEPINRSALPTTNALHSGNGNMSEAAETGVRTPRGGLGAALFLIAFAILAAGVQGLWIAFLIWFVIRAIF